VPVNRGAQKSDATPRKPEGGSKSLWQKVGGAVIALISAGSAPFWWHYALPDARSRQSVAPLR
jgi:hypothetical protein